MFQRNSVSPEGDIRDKDDKDVHQLYSCSHSGDNDPGGHVIIRRKKGRITSLPVAMISSNSLRTTRLILYFILYFYGRHSTTPSPSYSPHNPI